MTVTQKKSSSPGGRILLFDGDCAVCRTIAAWVNRASAPQRGRSTLIVRPIGHDPQALRALNLSLDIWDAYATIHLVMPDGSMKTGGEAVAEVFRNLPSTRWFAWIFALRVFGRRPFQAVLDFGYTILGDVRPLLGCESCGSKNPYVQKAKAVVDFFTAARVPGGHHSRRSS
jgi:predicted DCC family thiol-disulfide oxidoreductase YuxK